VLETALLWRTFADQCAECGKKIPVIQPDLTIDALAELQQRFRGNIERVVAESSTANPEESGHRLDEFTEMIRDTQAVTQKLARRGEEMVESLGELNSGMDESLKSKIRPGWKGGQKPDASAEMIRFACISSRVIGRRFCRGSRAPPRVTCASSSACVFVATAQPQAGKGESVVTEHRGSFPTGLGGDIGDRWEQALVWWG
jgi:hypothetical protein